MLKMQVEKQWKTELTDLVRGASGGFLFGIPLLYTMEVWWIGSYVSPLRMLFALGFTFLIVFLLNQTSGFRNDTTTRTSDALKDSVEALAIGIVCSGLTLVLLQEITFNVSLSGALGKLIYESVPFTLGVALANQFLGKDQSRSETHTNPKKGSATLSDISATLIGALIIAFNIAPTDEIPMLASAATGGWLLAMMAASLVISYCIVFAAGFGRQAQRYQHQGVFQRPFGETIAAYLVSLFAAMLMLVFFQKLHFDDPWQLWLRYTILLGLPAAVGGAAGRLAA
ncbi:integral membrane protein TIGR02587 [Leptolyngbya boryana NIES-2135]|jgi:putative integral membrane protein (TIGR02587 family)|uniref:Integral membrane protein TIGR02587 n=1 Tax=Leptolyngbya boryana NIES-2135 TaxID=1973484 RepID=A0A1Z4JNM4_LEPBY|nr:MULTISPECIES: TIGR02587 family membrane protein [Leptolyngbya]BAY58354.1 integral membrane protein TIGR02587 [Leptolyngbya boryana NIES-2135]MBD2368028.1 TIGR02587 family membrane protein [Leptolyngbya sp. FACHB-161]MBD2374552.1 TIGR02587 family membrane protein [Leptolyngbya sp. FACHB-238]MBD2398974.1 TIGR02587 family membrane protein [Leptolyngbya sp. FACHB-239]MBD2405363.1 TIGR02587 family membrane protein [Leptolyngbya sp. FACHB-402]